MRSHRKASRFPSPSKGMAEHDPASRSTAMAEQRNATMGVATARRSIAMRGIGNGGNAKLCSAKASQSADQHGTARQRQCKATMSNAVRRQGGAEHGEATRRAQQGAALHGRAKAQRSIDPSWHRKAKALPSSAMQRGATAKQCSAEQCKGSAWGREASQRHSKVNETVDS